MILVCTCGEVLSDAASPNDTEHLLISDRCMERLQDLVDAQVERDGVVDEWPEHWEESGGVKAWVCYACKRIYVAPNGPPEKIVVYSIEKVGHGGNGPS
jgi:hypothetical protein